LTERGDGDLVKPIVRCVCSDVRFAQMWEAGVRSLEDAARWFDAGTHCGLCRPYLLKMFATGETRFGLDD